VIAHYYYHGLNLIMPQWIVWLHPAFMLTLMPIAIYFFLLHRAPIRFLETILMLASCGFCIVYLMQKTYWYYHVLPAFTLSILLLIQLIYRYTLIFSNNTHKFKTYLFLLISAFFILHYPARYIYALNKVSIWEKKKGDIAELIHHLQQFPVHSTIYFFSGCLLPYPAVDYLQFKDQQLAQTYWFMPGIVVNPITKKIAYQAANTQFQHIPLLTQISRDMIMKRPDILVIDDRLNCNEIPFQFLTYFKTNIDFYKTLKSYRLVTRYETVSIYQKT